MYLHRPRLLRALQEGLPEGVLVHAPAGFGKTLLLKSFAEAKGLPYRRDWSPEPGCYDLRTVSYTHLTLPTIYSV